MKKLLLSLTLSFTYFVVSAQIKAPWTTFYQQIYGTEKEYISQVAIRDNKGYELYHLIGYKSYYTNGPLSFLQENNMTLKSVREAKGKMTYALICTDKNNKYGKVNMTCWLDKDDRIIKAQFSGNSKIMKQFFSKYWPSAPEQDYSQKPGNSTIEEKIFEKEKITFTDRGKKSLVEISR
ncbi:hypothetical protein [Rubrolithibacter danxiaensis]|uniref:hypothetical protein n=1 Tax=Rubrolithibacter danxiaensis TaxID=3390805 RepID=UPI003BF8118D